MKPLFTHSDKIVALAAGHVQDAEVACKRQATGDITFSNQPSAAETITINGVVYTFRASGAAGNEINIAASLTLTIDAIVTKLNAAAEAAVAKATYSNVGGTKLHVVHDAYGSAGNAFTLAEASATATTTATLSGGEDGDVIGLDAETVALTTAAGTVAEADLPAGEEGQQVTVYLKTKGTGANAQLNGAFVGGTKITFDTVGEFAMLKWLGSAWAPIANTGALA